MKLNLRRSLGIIICLSPVGLAGASFLAESRSPWWIALVLAGLAACTGVLNFWLSYVRPWIYKRRHSTIEGYRHASGMPVIGSLFAILAIVTSFGSKAIALLVILVLAIDTGGLPWFLVATWHDKTLWDAAA